MTIELKDSTLTITGNIKTIQDFQEIKTNLDRLVMTQTSIHFVLVDSISMTSSVIGYISKIIHKNGINVTMVVSNQGLYNLLEELCLIDLFKVRLAS